MSTTTRTQLCDLIQRELPSLVELRHDLHAHPELMYQEQRTSQVVARELEAIGVTHKTGLAGGTGVLGHLPATTDAQGPSVALRADMDALPIEENTGKAYASTNPGVMHACGHDGHTAMLVGAARVLKQLDDRPNPVTFVFQPAEEGGAGADKMCDDGALRGEGAGGLGTPVGRIFGQHGWPDYELGEVGTRPGPLLAATDEFDAVISGEQAHAAYPHQGADPIVAACAIVTALQTVASRNVGPLDSCVVTVGQINAGTAHNIIPSSASIGGTIRTLSPETRELAVQRVRRIIDRVASAHGCHAEVKHREGYPVTYNDEREAARFFEVADAALGRERVARVEHPTMGGEDFSFYGRHVPACFGVLGVRPPGASQCPRLHQPEYDFNDNAIALGVEMLCRMALSEG